tara:strand:- start:5844 stop:6857 length:1014 start_codon:yes stop_codon:yes gene_type:complete
MSNKRNKYIDIVKGISIIAIVLLHYEDGFFPTNVNVFIGMFMITAFYFTSGWLKGQSKNKISVKDLIRKRIPTLVKPYLWFSLILFIFDAILILLGFKEPILLLTDLYKTIVFRGIGTLWFLPALFGGEIIFVYLRDKNLNIKLIALSFSLLYSITYWYYSNLLVSSGDLFKIIEAPLRTLENILSAWIIIASGYYINIWLGKTLINLSKIKKTIVIIGLTSLSFFLIANLYLANFSSVIVTLILHIITPIIILLIAILTEHMSFNRFFIFWGKNSLILMVTHYTILMEVSIILNSYLTGFNYFGGMNAMYFFVGTMLFEYLIVFIINSKAKFLIGK